jgi:hypothetical protein
MHRIILGRCRDDAWARAEMGAPIAVIRRRFSALLRVAGLKWEEHGFNGWHIDHIHAKCHTYNEVRARRLSIADGLRRVNHYKNLQPLRARDNLRKGAA